jgi:hypothetical protein
MKDGIEAVDAHQLLRLGERQRPEQDSIEDEENGEIGGDAERQDQYGRSGEAGALAQLPGGIEDVLLEKIHHRLQPPDMAD